MMTSDWGRVRANTHRAAYRAAFPEKVAESYRSWCAKNPAYKGEYNAAYYANHCEEAKAYARSQRANYPEKIMASRVAYNSTHQEENAARTATWRAEHPEEWRASRKRHYDENHAVYIARNRNRRARLRKAPGSHTAADIAAQRTRQKGRCYWCGERVGRRYHVDHVVPLILGGSNGPENLVIACAPCNLRKGSKHPMEWAGVLC